MEQHELATEITLSGTMEPFLIFGTLSMMCVPTPHYARSGVLTLLDRLYGVVITQVYNYYNSYHDDMKTLRVAVSVNAAPILPRCI